MKQKGFFDDEARLKEISKLGDPLETLNQYIVWESFENILNEALKKETRGPGGRPAYNYVLMFKILILQKLYNMADDKTEYQIMDRLSFQRFLGLHLCDKVPDAKTIWNFREELDKADILETLFADFVKHLERKGVITRSGSIVDASFVDVPRQRNTKEDNKEIKEGKIPEEWKKEENRSKMAQKDVDARWATKNKERHYGYKNHIKIDKKSKIITKYQTTSAEVHDSQELKNLIEKKKDKRLYADRAYAGKELHKCIPKNVKNRIHEKGYRNCPLTKTQERTNTAKSRIRVRVEHVFARINHFGGLFIRTIGIRRAKVQIGLMNMAYNIVRFAYLAGAKV